MNEKKVRARNIWRDIVVTYFLAVSLIGHYYIYLNFNIESTFLKEYIEVYSIIFISMIIIITLLSVYLEKPIDYKSLISVVTAGPFVFIGTSSLSHHVPGFKKIETSIYILMIIVYLFIKLDELKTQRRLGKE